MDASVRSSNRHPVLLFFCATVQDVGWSGSGDGADVAAVCRDAARDTIAATARHCRRVVNVARREKQNGGQQQDRHWRAFVTPLRDPAPVVYRMRVYINV